MEGQFRDADELAKGIDEVMTARRQSYPTFKAAKDLLEGKSMNLELGRVNDEFTAQWKSLEGREQELLLQQYANQVST